jgi:hypothetical protein
MLARKLLTWAFIMCFYHVFLLVLTNHFYSAMINIYTHMIITAQICQRNIEARLIKIGYLTPLHLHCCLPISFTISALFYLYIRVYFIYTSPHDIVTP